MKYENIKRISVITGIFIISAISGGCSNEKSLNLEDIITLAESTETQNVSEIPNTISSNTLTSYVTNVSSSSSESEYQNTSEYILNTSSKKIHRSNCRSVDKIKLENYAVTADYEKALNEGYTPCGICKPE